MLLYFLLSISSHCFCFPCRFQIIDNSCDSLYELSAKAWGQYDFCGGDDYINLTQGFSSVVDAMLKQIPVESVRYQCPVKQILWNNLSVVNDQVVYSEENLEDKLDKLSTNVSEIFLQNMFHKNSPVLKKISLKQNGENESDGSKNCELPSRNLDITEMDPFCKTHSKPNEPHDNIIESHASIIESHDSIIKSHNSVIESHASLPNGATDPSNRNNCHSQDKNCQLLAHNSDQIQLESITKDLYDVIVKCVDGTCYRAKHVLVTTSLGYLKENQNHMFVPRLPKHWSQVR